MYTLTIIRISGGMFRGTMANGQYSRASMMNEIGHLPCQEDMSDIQNVIDAIPSGRSITLTLNGEDQHWICYISNVTK